MSDNRATVNDATCQLLAAVELAARDLDVRWLVTGAAARIILLEKVYGLPYGRATEDVDFGVMVESWAQFNSLAQTICSKSGFHPDPHQAQRLRSKGGYIDLIPFGGVASEDTIIRWPPHGDLAMNVAGFQEAYRDSVDVLVNDRLVVKVVSPTGLILLKLVAWQDRHATQPRKDAADIAYILHHASNFLGQETLFRDCFEIVESLDFDLELAAAKVLGHKIAEIASRGTLDRVQDLMEKELANETESILVAEVAGALPGSRDEDRAAKILQQVLAGLRFVND